LEAVVLPTLVAIQHLHLVTHASLQNFSGENSLERSEGIDVRLIAAKCISSAIKAENKLLGACAGIHLMQDFRIHPAI
jgi:hypothetical protein